MAFVGAEKVLEIYITLHYIDSNPAENVPL